MKKVKVYYGVENLENKDQHIERVDLFKKVVGEILKDYDDELIFDYIPKYEQFEPKGFSVEPIDVNKIEHKIPNCFI